ncbi:hypothetical protein NECAME_09761 [Necator americanus]|uniref:Uncharacterized protein n=1 Tax=Necator americanus TaxID=51031 RepID=W2TC04_NECAM|nr:hypothetical protein NECAME_09761 [Necator americanus]ETN79585.1 hypothetical protein NECAME_09761 [Necator americanus]
MAYSLGLRANIVTRRNYSFVEYAFSVLRLVVAFDVLAYGSTTPIRHDTARPLKPADLLNSHQRHRGATTPSYANKTAREKHRSVSAEEAVAAPDVHWKRQPDGMIGPATMWMAYRRRLY